MKLSRIQLIILLLLPLHTIFAGTDTPPPKFIAAAKEIDFAPRVRMGERQVDVDVIAYAPFRGIDRHHLEMSRTYPHRILTRATTNLLHHSQRFVF